MADLKEIPSLDTSVKADMNSWSTPPAGIPLRIESGPPNNFYLLIDDAGNRLLIE
jgi:hypothetical protein